MVLSFCGEEKGRFEDIGGVVCHERVRDVEALDVLYRCSLCLSISILPFLSIQKFKAHTLTSVGTFK